MAAAHLLDVLDGRNHLPGTTVQSGDGVIPRRERRLNVRAFAAAAKPG